MSGGSKPTKAEANTVLNLTLKGEITDRAYNNPVAVKIQPNLACKLLKENFSCMIL